ncbi:MAG: hypothetical protein COB85_04160, partial [Bacteroidetes bacterium]
MGKVRFILDALEKTQKSFSGSSTDELVSINDLRDKSERGTLGSQEKIALANYEKYRIKKLLKKIRKICGQLTKLLRQ